MRGRERRRRRSAPKEKIETHSTAFQKRKRRKKISGMDGCNGDSGMDSECNESIYWGWKDAIFLGFWHFCLCVSVTENRRIRESKREKKRMNKKLKIGKRKKRIFN
jgi:hypothetical protein